LSFIAELLIIGQKGKTSKMGGLGSGRPKTRERELILKTANFWILTLFPKMAEHFILFTHTLKMKMTRNFCFWITASIGSG
jgi:hypothetical protein